MCYYLIWTTPQSLAEHMWCYFMHLVLEFKSEINIWYVKGVKYNSQKGNNKNVKREKIGIDKKIKNEV